jgi:hypothetical protein
VTPYFFVGLFTFFCLTLQTEPRFQTRAASTARPFPSLASLLGAFGGDDDDAAPLSVFSPPQAMSAPPRQPFFDIFFSDDSVAVINIAPPPPPPPPPPRMFTLFFNSGSSPFLRGGAFQQIQEEEEEKAVHPCMSCASDLEKLCPDELEASDVDSVVASFHRQMCLMRNEDGGLIVFLQKSASSGDFLNNKTLPHQIFRRAARQRWLNWKTTW